MTVDIDVIVGGEKGPKARVGKRGRPQGSGKLAQRVAAEIERDILVRGARVGECLGTETEMLHHYGVSRSVLREAILLVERSGLARRQRGSIGGLFVAAVRPESVAEGLKSYLDFVTPDSADFSAIREALEDAAATLAMHRLSDAGLPELMEIAARAQRAATPLQRLSAGFDCYRAIANAAQSPVLNVLLMSLGGLTLNRVTRNPEMVSVYFRYAEDFAIERSNQLIAVIAGDTGRVYATQARIAALLRTFNDPSHRVGEPGQHPIPITTLHQIALGRGPEKLAETVARLIRDRVHAADMNVGHGLGSEAELMAEFHVSRGVLREAVRILERSNVAQMVRGKCGGLRVMAPNADAVVQSTCLYFKSLDIKPQHVREAVEALEILIVDEAARRSPPIPFHRLEKILSAFELARNGGTANRARAFCAMMGELAESGPLNVFMAILANLVPTGPEIGVEGLKVRPMPIEYWRSMFEAIARGDAAVARRKLLYARSVSGLS